MGLILFGYKIIVIRPFINDQIFNIFISDAIASIGMLSQTYLEAIKSETILVPTVSWSIVTHERIISPDSDASMHSISRYARVIVWRGCGVKFT